LVDAPTLFRPGVIPVTELEALIGPIAQGATPTDGGHASPGMHARHYRPQSPLYLWTPGDTLPVGDGRLLRVGIEMPADPLRYAAVLYETLHRLDAERPSWIAVELPPDKPEWSGVLDRLRRAAA